MTKAELNKLKAMQEKCDEYAYEAWEMVEAAYELAPKIYDKQILYNAVYELQKARERLRNANDWIIKAIFTEQPDYLENDL